ncbi:hypothetical protein D0B32_18510 [Paraburkholderia sp. DHOC27]|nr:hypothetical protein D0B32_18510 [Paraburkholderia sp. DHOC27]
MISPELCEFLRVATKDICALSKGARFEWPAPYLARLVEDDGAAKGAVGQLGANPGKRIQQMMRTAI